MSVPHFLTINPIVIKMFDRNDKCEQVHQSQQGSFSGLMSVQNFMVIRLMIVDIFQSGSKCWTDRLTNY